MEQAIADRQTGRVSASPPPLGHAVEGSLTRHYWLQCSGCATTFEDDGYLLECPSCLTPALLVAHYAARELRICAEEEGLYRYRDWLPVRRSLSGAGGTVTYRSARLARATGLKNLWIAFNGCWPERNAHLLSGSFKELEAYCVLGRLPANNAGVLVVSSAGNTAAAFARICSLHGVRCLIVVPETGLAPLRFAGPLKPWVKIVAVGGAADYADAIRLGGHVAKLPGFFAEGGAKNVARRDGLGSVLLNAFETIGRLPDYYFQAIGSGTGAIAVHENARRLTGQKGPFPHLWLSQNLPFAPICQAWKTGRKAWLSPAEPEARNQILQMQAPVLANRCPPYAIRGGLYEALVESEGDVIAVTNEQAMHAQKVFAASEQIVLDPAAAVAFASLLMSIHHRRLPQDATVLLNVTGGRRLEQLAPTASSPLKASLCVDAAGIENPGTLQTISNLFENL